MDELEGVVFPFEDTGETPLALLPLGARRALDVAGFRLPLEGYQSLSLENRMALAVAGSHDAVDGALVERIIKKSTMPASRIKPVGDPDPHNPPEQLNAALGARRAIEPAAWHKLRALERYALVHVMRRSIAHDDPSRLEAALLAILPRRSIAPSAVSEVPISVRHDDVTMPPVLGQGAGFEPEFSTAPPPHGYPHRPPSAPPPRQEGRRSASAPPETLDYSQRATRGVGELRRTASEPPATAARPPSMAELPAVLSSRPPHAQDERTVSTHLTEAGDVHMVDVAQKAPTLRRATASGSVRMHPETAQRVARHDAPKGEVLATARVAGIMAAKQTSALVPLCHPIALTSVEVLIDIEPQGGIIAVTAVAEAFDRTGVEMEALTAVSVACLTIYDMLKGIDRDLVIGELRLLSKTGGRSRP